MKSLIKNRYGWQLILAIILVINLFSVAAVPVQASSSCKDYYWVQYGDTLYKIGVKYGITWTDIANANGIGSPYTIYYGTSLCIPYGGSSYYSNTYYTYSAAATGDFSASILDVTANKNFTLKAINLPKQENFEISVGKCNYAIPTVVGEFSTGSSSGSFTDTYKIPSKFKNVSCLVMYMDSTKTTRSTSITFTNSSTTTSSSSTADFSNLKFSINSVTKNKTVTIRVTDFRKNEKYKVYIGKYGTGAYPGTLVGTFKQENNQDFNLKLNIPTSYKGSDKLDIRIEGVTVAASTYHTFRNVTD